MCKLMQKLTVYKNANISVGRKSLLIGGVSYPLDDVLYAEVRDNEGKVSEAFMSPYDLFAERLLRAYGSLFWMFPMVIVVAWNTSWAWLLYLALAFRRIGFNPLKNRFTRNRTPASYTLFVHFRSGSIQAYTANVLFYPQMISRRINNTVKQRVLSTEPISLTNQY